VACVVAARVGGIQTRPTHHTPGRTGSHKHRNPTRAPTNAPRRAKRSPRIQSLSLELGSCSAHTRFLEDSWRGEILPDFLFLGDRVTASDQDRLQALRIT